MSDYIFCSRKRNAPRMNVRVCQKKCIFKDDCREFLTYQQEQILKDQSPIFNSKLIMPPLLNPMESKN